MQGISELYFILFHFYYAAVWQKKQYPVAPEFMQQIDLFDNENRSGGVYRQFRCWHTGDIVVNYYCKATSLRIAAVPFYQRGQKTYNKAPCKKGVGMHDYI